MRGTLERRRGGQEKGAFKTGRGPWISLCLAKSCVALNQPCTHLLASV